MRCWRNIKTQQNTIHWHSVSDHNAFLHFKRSKRPTMSNILTCLWAAVVLYLTGTPHESRQCLSECEEGAGVCALLMTGLSLFIIILSLPVSLVFVVKVVQVKMFIEVLEYFYYITWNFEISQQPLCTKTDTFYFSCSILWHDDIIREFFARTLNWYERHIFCQ